MVALFVNRTWSMARIARFYCLDDRRVKALLVAAGAITPSSKPPVKRAKRRARTEELVKEVVDDYTIRKMTIDQITKKHDRSYNQIHNILTEHGVEFRGTRGGKGKRPRRRPNPNPRATRTPELTKNVVDDYTERSMTIEAIADERGSSYAVVYNILRDAGVEFRHGRGVSYLHGPVTQATIDEVVLDYTERKMTIQAIADKHGPSLSYDRTYTILKDAGVKFRRGRGVAPPRKITQETIDEVVQDYIERQMSIRAIAAKYGPGLSYNRTRDILKAAGVQFKNGRLPQHGEDSSEYGADNTDDDHEAIDQS